MSLSFMFVVIAVICCHCIVEMCFLTVATLTAFVLWCSIQLSLCLSQHLKTTCWSSGIYRKLFQQRSKTTIAMCHLSLSGLEMAWAEWWCSSGQYSWSSFVRVEWKSFCVCVTLWKHCVCVCCEQLADVCAMQGSVTGCRVEVVLCMCYLVKALCVSAVNS